MPRKKSSKPIAATKNGKTDRAHRMAELIARSKDFLGDTGVLDPEGGHNVEVCSSGLVSLDMALGVGGWAFGRIHCILGPEHAGKTSLALLGLAQIQRQDPEAICAFIDIERTYSASLAHLCGVDTDRSRLIRLEADTAEQGLDLVSDLCGFREKDHKWGAVRPPAVRAIIYDSWAGSPTEVAGMGALGRVGAEKIPALSAHVSKAKVLLWLINQIRLKPGTMWGNPEYGPGGETFKHAQTTRVAVHKIGEVEKDSANRRIGHTMKLDIQKNKLAPPFGTTHVNFNYFKGFDQISDAYGAAEMLGMDFHESANILKFDFPDPKTQETVTIRANGERAFFEELRTDPDAAEAFKDVVKRAIENKDR